MSRKGELAKNTAILTFGKICTQFISFLLLPLYTAILQPADYGVFDLLTTYATLLLPLINWQFDQGVFRYMLEYRKDKEQQQKLFSTILTIHIIQSLIFIVIMIIINSIHEISHISFLILYVTIQVFVALFLQFIRGLGKNSAYAVASFISAVSTVLLNILTLVVIKLGLSGLFISSIIAQVITLLYMIFVTKPWNYFEIKLYSKEEFKKVSSFSLPLIPNNLAWWIVGLSDRTIISHVLNVSMNGIYTVANKFSNVFIQFYNVFNLSWTETVTLHYLDDDRDEFLSETMTSIYKLFSSACLGIVALMPFIFPLLVDEKYSEAYPQIIILMYAMLLRVLVGLYSCIYIATKESKKIAYTSAILAVINIIVNLLFIKSIGLYAASISTVVAFGSMLIVRYIDINKTIHMKIKASILISSLSLALILAVTYFLNYFWINIIMLIIITVYSIVINLSLFKSGVIIVKNYLKK